MTKPKKETEEQPTNHQTIQPLTPLADLPPSHLLGPLNRATPGQLHPRSPPSQPPRISPFFRAPPHPHHGHLCGARTCKDTVPTTADVRPSLPAEASPYVPTAGPPMQRRQYRSRRPDRSRDVVGRCGWCCRVDWEGGRAPAFICSFSRDMYLGVGSRQHVVFSEFDSSATACSVEKN